MSLASIARYKHYCDKCIYLGQYVDSEGAVYDLYFCENRVLARYGNDGYHYLADLATNASIPCLKAAYGYAKARGLVE